MNSFPFSLSLGNWPATLSQCVDRKMLEQLSFHYFFLDEQHVGDRQTATCGEEEEEDSAQQRDDLSDQEQQQQQR